MKWAIDVSSYDAKLPDGTYQAVDWHRSGLNMAMIKASEGMSIDPAFTIQWKAAQGLPRVAYHFFRSNVNAIAQAQFFLSIVEKDFGPYDRVSVDFETTDGQSNLACLAAVASFLHEVDKKIFSPMIYTYPSFWTGIGGEKALWAVNYPLWLAQWPKDTWVLWLPITIFDAPKLAALKGDIESGVIKPLVLKPWSSPAIWQFTARADTRAVAGHPAYKKVCDYNAVFVTINPVVQFKVCPTCGGTGQVPV